MKTYLIPKTVDEVQQLLGEYCSLLGWSFFLEEHAKKKCIVAAIEALEECDD